MGHLHILEALLALRLSGAGVLETFQMETPQSLESGPLPPRLPGYSDWRHSSGGGRGSAVAGGILAPRFSSSGGAMAGIQGLLKYFLNAPLGEPEGGPRPGPPLYPNH